MKNHCMQKANGHDSPAEGAKVASRMFIQMRNNGGPLENLTALACEGPNVSNKFEWMQQISKDNYGQLTGFFILEVVHILLFLVFR